METKELKARLIKKIETADENELRQLEVLLNSFGNQEDWFNAASPAFKDALKKSIAQIERGELIPHEQVMREIRDEYGLEEGLDVANPPQEIKDLLELAQKQVTNGQIKTNEEVKEIVKEKYGFRLK